MTQLHQQELMEPGPSRRLIVPRGHTSWWGVDPSTRRVAIAGVSLDARGVPVRWVQSAAFAPSDGLERLSEVYAQTYTLARSLAAGWPPGLVLVEQPGGEHRNYPLFYATGVIAAAIDAAVFEATMHRARLDAVVPASWKKSACGRGNIYKPKRGEAEYGVLTWARENGYTGTLWDEADAWGIAEAARRTVGLEER